MLYEISLTQIICCKGSTPLPNLSPSIVPDTQARWQPSFAPSSHSPAECSFCNVAPERLLHPIHTQRFGVGQLCGLFCVQGWALFCGTPRRFQCCSFRARILCLLGVRLQEAAGKLEAILEQV